MSDSAAAHLERTPTPAKLSSTDGVVHESDRTLVVRRHSANAAAVVLKRALGTKAAHRLRHERAVLQRLHAVEGVARLQPGTWDAHILALRDDDGVPLNQVIAARRLPLPDVVSIGLQLARTLAEVHRLGVIHKRINPSNILLCGAAQRPVLIDFGSASTDAEDDMDAGEHDPVAAMQLYVPPEQTGRTGRPVDQRSDLYALGAVLYLLITGQPLFDASDLLDVLHHQLTTVPTPPAELAPATPRALSDLVMQLLEKEPDRRYHSAYGVAHDLDRLSRELALGQPSAFMLGERDFPARLAAPSSPIGRGDEIDALHDALDDAVSGTAICLLVSGASGVGKTALLKELHPAATGRPGWFVSGRFDPSNKDGPSATVQALRALGRLLLSQPEAELARHRERLVQALGPNIDAGITLMSEYELLLGPQQVSRGSEPLEAEKRMLQGAVAVLRSVASPTHPLVMVLDDAHGAPEISMRFVDAVLAARAELPGLVLALAYRPQDLHDTSPLQAALARWQRLSESPRTLALAELTPRQVGELVGGMLRLPLDEAGRLAAVLNERTQGNPQATIDLINALRGDGLLTPDANGWQWDEQDVRRYVGRSDDMALLTRRLDKLPQRCRSVMNTLACLGGEVSAPLLEAACGTHLGELKQALAMAVDDGLVVADTRDVPMFRLRTDRLHACVLEQLGEAAQHKARLAIARHLAPVPEFERHAALQYLEVQHELSDAAERRSAARLLRRAAYATLVANPEGCIRLSAAAIDTLRPVEQPSDGKALLALLMQRHFALYGLGRHEEADAVYAEICARCDDPYALADAAGVQVHSLSNRGNARAALDMGLQLLARLDLHKPADLGAAIGAGLRAVSAWAMDPTKSSELQRPEVNDPQLLVRARLMKRVMMPAFAEDRAVHTWLMTQAHRLWVEHGPCAPLMSAIASLPLLLSVALKNYHAAHAAALHAISLGEARGYEPATSMARTMAALCTSCWVGPIEDVVTLSHRARAGLMQAGDVQFTSYTYSVATHALMDSARTLDSAWNEIESALAFEVRTGHHGYTPVTQVFRQVVCALRGDTQAPGSFNDGTFDEQAFLAQPGLTASTAVLLHVFRSMSALVFNDHAAIEQHATVALAMGAATPGFYASALPHLTHGVATAEQIRAAHRAGTDTAELQARLDAHHQWLSERAVDAPANFEHLASLLDAERAWARGDTATAARAYERALVEVERHTRPWHLALIHERAARFYFAHGLDRTGRSLLVEALRAYDDWGAAGKVRALLGEFPLLREAVSSRRSRLSVGSAIAATDAIDMMAILRASQALSSQTSLANLNAAVVKVLGALCGATHVQLVVRPRETPGWFLATSLQPGSTPLSVAQAGAQGLLALSAFHYTERTRQQLLLEDATRDPRFSADPALQGLAHCSLLLMPIVKQGDMQAVLVLENRMRHSAFSADRLDAVNLIAGQLAVSLDNALLYAALESKVAERTAALEEANRKLEQLSVTDALTGLPNRRQFNQALDVEWERARRAGTPVGLAMIDIDQFKHYNDHYGHQGGDACLQLVAQAMKSGLRAGTDLIARYGGEEFVLLLRDSDLTGALACAERVRVAVAAQCEPHAEARHGIVTVSIGVAACVPGEQLTAAQCLEQADIALYQAKRGGRNQVASLEAPPANPPATA